VAIVGGYRIHTFLGSGTFTLDGKRTVEYLVIGGGGGGGGGTGHAGGGGAGGFLTGSAAVTAPGLFGLGRARWSRQL